MQKVIRSADYAQRLEMACDQHPHCPPLHKGRYQWIVDNFPESITTETVRKWSKGESKPKQDKNAMLAALLQVDPTWLFMGIDPDLEPKERRVRNAMASGVVNVVAGMIQMDGGSPAFPDEGDARAQRENIDLYAIIKGASYSLHIAVGEREGKTARFVVPTRVEQTVVLGVLRDGMAFEIVELTPEMIAEGVKRGGSIEITLKKWVGITGFDKRL